MKFLVIVLLSLFVQAHCASFAKLDPKENQTEVDQQRSARVHRVSDQGFAGSDDLQIKNTVKDAMIKQAILLGNQGLEKLLVDFPNLSNLVQREAQLFKELNVILMDLARDGTVTLKNIDLAISEMMDANTSSESIKSTSKSDNDFGSLPNSLDDLDTYGQTGQSDGSEDSSRISNSRTKNVNDQEPTSVRNVTNTLDNVLREIQNHIAFVRNLFDRLCRKHHSTMSIHVSANDSGKFPSMNQPRKVSIL